jgi:hypothetical protein
METLRRSTALVREAGKRHVRVCAFAAVVLVLGGLIACERAAPIRHEGSAHIVAAADHFRDVVHDAASSHTRLQRSGRPSYRDSFAVAMFAAALAALAAHRIARRTVLCSVLTPTRYARGQRAPPRTRLS